MKGAQEMGFGDQEWGLDVAPELGLEKIMIALAHRVLAMADLK